MKTEQLMAFLYGLIVVVRSVLAETRSGNLKDGQRLFELPQVSRSDVGREKGQTRPH